MNNLYRTLYVLLLTLVLTSCNYDVKLLKVGSKNFTESNLLAEIIATLAEQDGIPVKRIIPFGDELDSMAAIQKGILDIYPEYNGTALVLLGLPPLADSGAGWRQLRPAFKPLGLTWTTPFGFQDDYVLVVTKELSEKLAIKTIGDLSKLNEQGVRFATDDTFPERPIDGLGALTRRYGINQGEVKSFSVADSSGKIKIYESLLNGEVDVAEVYSTDGEIGHYKLVTLEDNLSFFPAYSAAPLVRTSALEQFPNLASVLEKLGNNISAEEMREMNFAVDFYGESVKQAASKFLIKKGLVDANLLSNDKVDTISIAASNQGDLIGGALSKGWSAVRSVYSHRQVALKYVADPVNSVISGQSRLGITTSESVFELNDNNEAVLRPGIEVVGTLGYKSVHLLTLRSQTIDDIASIRRLGTGYDHGESDIAAEMMLTSLTLRDKITIVNRKNEDDYVQFESLRAGDIDGILMLAETGDKKIAAQLERGDLKLLSIPEWSEGHNALRFAFLRPSKIAKNTYTSQTQALDTATVQIILISPVNLSQSIGTHGPVSTDVSSVSPISPDNTLKLNQALKDISGSSERVDPVLPVAAALKRSPVEEFSSIQSEIDVTLVNLFFLVLLGIMFGLYKKEKSKVRKKPT